MRRTLLAGILVTLGPVAAPRASADAVYVSKHPTVYHRLDCRRLRFERPVERARAIASYRPCPVCRPELLAVPAEPAEPREAHEAALGTASARGSQVANSPRHGSGKTKQVVAMILGGVAGFVGGTYWAFADCPWGETGGCDAARIIPLAVAGAIGGYALAGGFSDDRVDLAIERGRAAVAEAAALRASAADSDSSRRRHQ